MDPHQLAQEDQLQLFVHQHGDQHGDEDAQGDDVVAHADDDAQAGHAPQTGCGGQTPDPLVRCNDDGARTDETDAGNDLCSHTGRVKTGTVDLIQVQAAQHGAAGADTNQRVCTHTGGAALTGALYAQDTAGEHCQSQADQGCDGVEFREINGQ